VRLAGKRLTRHLARDRLPPTAFPIPFGGSASPCAFGATHWPLWLSLLRGLLHDGVFSTSRAFRFHQTGSLLKTFSALLFVWGSTR
jgi:hypothetical protein